MTDTVKVPRAEWVDYLAATLDKAPSEIRRALTNLEIQGLIAASPQGEGSPIGQNDQPGLAFSGAGEP